MNRLPTMLDMNKLGELLKERRREQGVTLEAVSAETGLSKQTLSRLENLTYPSRTTIETATVIIEWLGLSPLSFIKAEYGLGRAYQVGGVKAILEALKAGEELDPSLKPLLAEIQQHLPQE